MVKYIIILALLCLIKTSVWGQVSVQKILENADYNKGVYKGLGEVTVKEFKRQEKIILTDRKFRLACDYSTSNIQSFLLQESPKVGKFLLLPTTSQTLDNGSLKKINASQDWQGMASIYDIANVPLSLLYNAEATQDVVLDGLECYQLKLIPKNKSIGYSHLIYWIEKITFKPVKLEYWKNTERIKTAMFKEFQEIANHLMATEIWFTSDAEGAPITQIHYSGFLCVRFPQKMWHANSLTTMNISSLEWDTDVILQSSDTYKTMKSWGFHMKILVFNQLEQTTEPQVLSEQEWFIANLVTQDKQEKTIIEFLSPPRERGKRLFVGADGCWSLLTDTPKPTMIPSNQKIAGSLFAGDMASFSIVTNYHGRVLDVEVSNNKKYYSIYLSPKKTSSLYGHLKYWVETDSLKPHKIEYYSLAGKLLKTAHFRNFVQAGVGQNCVEEIFFTDVQQKNRITRLNFSEFKPIQWPSTAFRADGFYDIELAIKRTGTLTAEEVVQKADEFRGAKNWTSYLKIYDFQKKDEAKVVASGEFKIHVQTTSDNIRRCRIDFISPSQEVGKAILYDGKNYWQFFPHRKNWLAIGPEQRLLGSASVMDIANLNMSNYSYAFDTPSEEDILGQICYVVVLSAKSNYNVLYPRLRYWVAKNNYYPVKIECFSVNNRHIKSVYFRKLEFAPGMNATKCHEIFIVDVLQTGRTTRVLYSNSKAQETPDSLYQKDNK